MQPEHWPEIRRSLAHIKANFHIFSLRRKTHIYLMSSDYYLRLGERALESGKQGGHKALSLFREASEMAVTASNLAKSANLGSSLWAYAQRRLDLIEQKSGRSSDRVGAVNRHTRSQSTQPKTGDDPAKVSGMHEWMSVNGLDRSCSYGSTTSFPTPCLPQSSQYPRRGRGPVFLRRDVTEYEIQGPSPSHSAQFPAKGTTGSPPNASARVDNVANSISDLSLRADTASSLKTIPSLDLLCADPIRSQSSCSWEEKERKPEITAKSDLREELPSGNVMEIFSHRQRSNNDPEDKASRRSGNVEACDNDSDHADNPKLFGEIFREDFPEIRPRAQRCEPLHSDMSPHLFSDDTVRNVRSNVALPLHDPSKGEAVEAFGRLSEERSTPVEDMLSGDPTVPDPTVTRPQEVIPSFCGDLPCNLQACLPPCDVTKEVPCSIPYQLYDEILQKIEPSERHGRQYPSVTITDIATLGQSEKEGTEDNKKNEIY